VAQRVGRGIALLFHDRGTRSGWVGSSTPRPHFTPRKDPVPILQEAGWAPGPVWTGGKSRPHWNLVPDRPACGQSLYRLSYRAHEIWYKYPTNLRLTVSSFKPNSIFEGSVILWPYSTSRSRSVILRRSWLPELCYMGPDQEGHKLHSPHFMELVGSLRHSQDRAVCLSCATGLLISS